MSQENVEIVRRVVTEFTETHQLSELVSPDLVWDLGSWSAWRGQPQFYGHDGFMEFFAEWTDAYADWTQEVENFIDAGECEVVVTARQRGRLRDSDSWVALRLGFVYTVKGGRMVRAEVYASPEEALEAAGLREWRCRRRTSAHPLEPGKPSRTGGPQGVSRTRPRRDPDRPLTPCAVEVTGAGRSRTVRRPPSAGY